jgi:hypothetical protein
MNATKNKDVQSSPTGGKSMNTKMKNLLYSVAIVGAFASSPTWASNPVEMEPVAGTTTATSVVAVDAVGVTANAPVVVDDKGKEDVSAGAAAVDAATASGVTFAANDLLAVMNLFDAIKAFKTEVKGMGGMTDAENQDALIRSLLAKDGVVDDSLKILSTLAGYAKIAEDKIQVVPGSRGAKCLSCCKTATLEVQSAADQLSNLLEMIEKYALLINKLEQDTTKGADASDVMHQLIKAGVLKDINYVLSFKKRYDDAYAAKKAADAAPAPRSMFRKK